MPKKEKLVGNYRLLKEIAEGGFGRTYKGEHALLHMPVCVKHALHISPQDRDLLFQEAKTIWDLRHYGIPSIRDVVVMDDGSVAIVMSYVAGPTIAQLVEKRGGLDPEHVAWITDRALNILKYLHYHGVVHGDVKPQNIIVQPDHLITLVDYGLSAIKPRAGEGNKGYTPDFASPEQVVGGTILPESDFYGLGMTMIFALGGDIRAMSVPDSTPKPMIKFIKKLIVRDVLGRPNWAKEDLCQTIENVRKESFGRTFSNMKPL